MATSRASPRRFCAYDRATVLARAAPWLASAHPSGAGRAAAGAAERPSRGLPGAVDAKDPSTRRHSERVADLSWAIAGALGWKPDRRRLLHEAAVVHDVGKIAIPDQILFKPARLSESRGRNSRIIRGSARRCSKGS